MGIVQTIKKIFSVYANMCASDDFQLEVQNTNSFWTNIQKERFYYSRKLYLWNAINIQIQVYVLLNFGIWKNKKSISGSIDHRSQKWVLDAQQGALS